MVTPLFRRNRSNANCCHCALEISSATSGQSAPVKPSTGSPSLARVAPVIASASAASTVIVEHRALTRKRWAELMAAHPAREGNEQDAQFGVNVWTFVDAALADAITGATSASDGEPVEGFTGADWSEVADEISNAQWQQFAFDLFRLNNGVTTGPTSRTASLVMRSSETNSEKRR